MYYIGYTSAIAGGDSNLVFEYLEKQLLAQMRDEEDVIEYPLGYFSLGMQRDERYVIHSTRGADTQTARRAVPESGCDCT